MFTFQKKSRLLNFFFFLIFSFLVPLKAEVFYSIDGIALDGYDPVSFYIEEKPLKGKEKYNYIWNDVTWLFYDKINLELFKYYPEKFLPEYGGFCAYTISQGGIASANFEFWEVKNNRLYFFHSLETQKFWLKKSDNYLKLSESLWSSVKKKYSPFFEKDGNHISLMSNFY